TLSPPGGSVGPSFELHAAIEVIPMASAPRRSSSRVNDIGVCWTEAIGVIPHDGIDRGSALKEAFVRGDPITERSRPCHAGSGGWGVRGGCIRAEDGRGPGAFAEP